jgi:hypothetical protein
MLTPLLQRKPLQNIGKFLKQITVLSNGWIENFVLIFKFASKAIFFLRVTKEQKKYRK